MKHLVGRTRNNIAVYVDLIQSNAAKHIARQPHLLKLVGEVLGQRTLRGPEHAIEHDMGRTIGYNFVVKTVATDTIFYAQGVRETTFTRYVKNGKPLSTQYVTLLLSRSTDEVYELRDAWIGQLSPPRPGTTDETADSRPYWAAHAFVPDDRPLQLRSITKTCPY